MNGHDKGKQITIKCKRKNFRCEDGRSFEKFKQYPFISNDASFLQVSVR